MDSRNHQTTPNPVEQQPPHGFPASLANQRANAPTLPPPENDIVNTMENPVGHIHADALRAKLVKLEIVTDSAWEMGRKSAKDPNNAVAILKALEFPATQENIASSSTRNAVLTPYQVAQILRGNVEQLRLGDHVILDRIGAGAMGEVFMARNRTLSRIEAVKTISAYQIKDENEDATLIARFKHEAKMLAKLNHPNITTVYSAGYQVNAKGVIPYIAMELIHGDDMNAVVEQWRAAGKPFPISLAVRYVYQTALALKHAHENNVIHCDIKPSNIMVTPRGDLKVLDMGIARLSTKRESSSGVTALALGTDRPNGTPAFMAPEQWNNARDVTPSSDVYSLGCTFYFMLTGQVLFDEPSVLAIALAHMQHPIPRATTLRKDIPAKLEKVLEKMLAKEPGQRYRTALQLCHALEPFLENRPKPRGPMFWAGLGSVALTLIVGAYLLTRGSSSPKSANLGLEGIELWSDAQLAQALTEIQAELYRQPEDGSLYARRGAMLARQGKTSEALADLHRAVQWSPTAPHHHQRGQFLLLQGDANAALEDLKKARELEPNVGAYQQSLIQGFAAVTRQHLIHKRFQDAVKNHQHARAEALTNTEHDQLAARAHIGVGESQAANSNHQGAVAEFDLALSLDETSAGAYLGRARSLAALGERERSQADFAKAAALSMDESGERAAAAAQYAENARAKASAGDHTGAVAAYEQAAALDTANALRLYGPHLAKSRAVLARLALEKNDYPHAIAHFREALQQHPEMKDSYRGPLIETQLKYARELRNAGDWAKAMEMCDSALGLDPKRADAMAERGRALAARGEHAKALLDFNRAAELDPLRSAEYRKISASSHAALGSDALSRGDNELALAEFREAMNLDPNKRAEYENKLNEAEVAQGTAFFHANEFDKALAIWNKVLSRTPNHPLTLAKRGSLYLNRKQYPLAAKDLQRALELDPELKSGYKNSLGEALGKAAKAAFDAKQFKDSARDYAAAAELDPSVRDAYRRAAAVSHNFLGFEAQQQKDFDLAIKEYTRAIDLSPKDAVSYRNRGAAYKLQGGDSLALALNDYTIAIGIDPLNALAYKFRGEIQGFLLQEKKYKQAIDDLKEAVRLDARDASTHYMLGYLLGACPELELRDGALAVVHATKACEATEFKNWEYVLTLSAGYAQAADFDRAMERAQQALELAPETQKSNVQQVIEYLKKRQPLP